MSRTLRSPTSLPPGRHPGPRGRAGRIAAFGLCLLLASGAPAAATADASSGRAPDCDYRITLSDPAARMLSVTADCRAAGPVELRPRAPLLRRHIAALQVDGRPVDALDLFDWQVTPVDGHARFAYRFDLAAAADDDQSMDGARRFGRTVVAPLRTWLLAPAADGAELRLRFEAPRGGAVLTGLEPAAPPAARAATAEVPEPPVMRLRANDLAYGGYALLGTFRAYDFTLPASPLAPGEGPARITLGLPDPPFALSDEELLRWVIRSAEVVAGYWDGMPTRRSLFVLAPEPMSGGVMFGRVRGGGGTTGFISLGEFTERAQLYRSWELIHEMMHLGSPFLRDGFWFMEGFATYAEPVARARAGWRSAEDVWAEFLRGMPRGLAAMTGGGMGGRSIDAVYWGGALFMLLADVAIRAQSGNRLGLEDCMRAVLARGGDAAQRWRLDQALAACDRATGGSAVSRLVQRHVRSAHPLDLEALWRDLGVIREGDGVTLVDDAPLAAIRRAITGPANGSGAMPQREG